MCLYIQSANYNIQRQPSQHLSEGMASISSWCIFSNVVLFSYFYYFHYTCFHIFDRDCKIYFDCMHMHAVFELNDKESALIYVIRHSKLVYLESPHFYPKSNIQLQLKNQLPLNEKKSFYSFSWHASTTTYTIPISFFCLSTWFISSFICLYYYHLLIK